MIGYTSQMLHFFKKKEVRYNNTVPRKKNAEDFKNYSPLRNPMAAMAKSRIAFRNFSEP